MEKSNQILKLQQALQPRLTLLSKEHTNAFRLFNGYREGFPGLTIDLFGSCLVISNHTDQPESLGETIRNAVEFYRTEFPWLTVVLVKTRRSADPAERKGRLIFGSALPDRIQENGVWYAIDLQMNQDSSFYLDTRILREWLIHHSAGKTVLNTFAYTGSLGIAALIGGAASVLQTDLNHRFLEIAQLSATLNPVIQGSHTVRSGDFFRIIGAFRHQGALFDVVILDAPFFSQTTAGKVDLVNQATRLINKIRPLVAPGGRLIAINNALFVKGADYLADLQKLCLDGYMEIEQIIPVPQDFIGYTNDFQAGLPVDPAPFNHSTKIAILHFPPNHTK